ncbi:ATP-binding protein [Bacillus methanolicus]|uniref:IS21-like element helper ATPase IstB n=1 Tax=Bacillus methanolicus TaxID=1471 RepID=UPI00238099E4|nr:IS21-like element helper ATPase IstB [Bacillus methanolicus]MDE3837800.1 ATP-binding protein [Bacillus methanolicus]MDE3840668.1 ATP-binding protein [Bacillus methanolicus]MDE3840761.1 ATP-binding protein [Bacillus methanolicus]MDE3840853.1 ATP-binding protein [Bacillus methanolicus]
MNSLSKSQELLKALRLKETAHYLPTLVKEAETNDSSYLTFLNCILEYEQKRREEKQLEKRLKWANFPFQRTIDEFNLEEQQSLSRKQLNQLKELTWIEQLYNIIFLGPPGVGKTHLAVGLGFVAINQGYKVMFITMGELIHTLKTEEISRKSQTKIKRIRSADLIIIDDLMFMAMDQHEANLFFHLINDLYNKSSIILTSNKAPKEWGELLGDPAITTAILDRILHKAEIIHLNEDSYRMKHRSSIFN